MSSEKQCIKLPALLLPALLLFCSLPALSAQWKTGAPEESPELELADESGNAYRLGDHAGKVVIVNFWASWCTPCVRELPGLNRLRKHFGDRPFDIVGVNVAERPRRLVRFLQQHPIDFPVVYDRESTAFDAWGVKALPTSFIIDRNGMIRFRVTGAVEWDNADSIAIIEKLLDEVPAPANPLEE